ncbi:hypothetical protein HALLA_18505 [Halostagnicola larsenii XH-48]|uniref:Uncharacterized protein n=1 Tax=Halostagnicola larsenii XH-48 TaxID=797299 RepID=W0JR01_9EURY|nr:hypothetical protein HALLA_18505 [Halostagnicola larsenii XH-48]
MGVSLIWVDMSYNSRTKLGRRQHVSADLATEFRRTEGYHD